MFPPTVAAMKRFTLLLGCVLAASCLLYLALRIGFTSGYAHQIDPAHIVAQLKSLNFSAHFFIQMILAQGLLVLLLVFIANKRARFAAYLLVSAAAVAVTALAAGEPARLRVSNSAD